MSYALGVDLGTTFTAAAVARGSTATPVTLGVDAIQMPSVVLFREDGEVVVGDAAERRAPLEPSRVAREFKRRLGDPVPILVAGQPHRSEDMMAAVLTEVLRRVTAEHGEPPIVVVLTHPANYSDQKLALLRETATRAGLAEHAVALLAEPEAAAVAYSRERVIEVGEVVAVYDFGGGTFDAALVRRGATGFELIGIPEGMERLGGIDIDQALLARVNDAVGGAVASADRTDPGTLEALVRLRGECRRAKEALSVDTETSVPVVIPGVNTSVRVTRTELEDMVRPRIADSIRALERAVASAGMSMSGVSRVLLVGGTSRMPLVAQMVEVATSRPAALDVNPKMAVPVGAALIGAATLEGGPGAPAAAAGAAAPTRPPTPSSGPDAAELPSAAASQSDAWTAPAIPARTRQEAPPVELPVARRRRGAKLAAGIGLVAGLAVGGVLAFGRGSDGDEPTAAATTPAGAETTSAAPGTRAPTTAGSTTGAGVANVVDRYAFGGSAGTGVPGPRLEAGVGGIAAIGIDSAGLLYAVSADARVLVVDGDQVRELAALPADAGVPGGIVVTADGQVLVSTARGVERIAGGGPSLVLDGAVAGIGRTPGALALDGLGNLYVADVDHHRVVRQGVDGSLSLVAGNGAQPTADPAPDGLPASSVAIGRVSALAIGPRGELVIGDDDSKIVRVVSSDNLIRTVAGGGSTAVSSLGIGTPATSVALDGVNGIGVDAADRVYVSDADAGVIVRFAADGEAEVVIARRPGVAVEDGVAADASSVGTLGPLVVSAAGDLFFVDDATVRRLTI